MVYRSLTAASYSTIQLLQNVEYPLKQQKFQELKDDADIKLKLVRMIYSAKDIDKLNIEKVRQLDC